MRINRLFQIVITLINKGTVTSKELAEKFEVSSRTIYRDIDELSAAGIPIYTTKGNGGGITLLEEYTINKALISEQESESLIFALKTLQATNFPEVDHILDKMNAIFSQVKMDDWIEVDFTHWGATKEIEDRFQTIKIGILKRFDLQFDYINSSNQKANRVVHPLKLFFKGQTWYLWAFCVIKNDFRIFKISRMKNISLREEQFNREEIMECATKPKIEKDKIKFVHLRLKFSNQLLYRLHDYYDENMLIKNNDGTYTVEVTFPENEWIFSYILSFGNDVEVLGPAYVREEIQNRLTKMIQIYK